MLSVKKYKIELNIFMSEHVVWKLKKRYSGIQYLFSRMSNSEYIFLTIGIRVPEHKKWVFKYTFWIMCLHFDLPIWNAF